MKKEDIRKLSFYVGLVVSIVSIYLAFIKVNHWYHPAVIGVWLVFDYISSRKNKTSFDYVLNKDWKTFFNIYLWLVFFGILIEYVGNFLLNLWYYPFITDKFLYVTIFPLYPFILMSFREMYNVIGIYVKNSFFVFILSMILGIVIWEIPNLYSFDWIYTVPFVDASIFNINILIILAWSILIWIPLLVYNNILKLK